MRILHLLIKANTRSYHEPCFTCNLQAMKVTNTPPMNGEYFLKLTSLFAYIFSQEGCDSLTTAPPFGMQAGETATKSYYAPAELKSRIQEKGEGETAFNGFALNPFWSAVANVPYNLGNVKRLTSSFRQDKFSFNNVKFMCYCPDNSYNPSDALGDIKVLSPLEPLHAAVFAFVEEHQEGMSERSFLDWVQLFRSTTCHFKVIADKQDFQ